MKALKRMLRAALNSIGLDLIRYPEPGKRDRIEKGLFECLLKLKSIPQPNDNQSEEFRFVRFCLDNLMKSHAQLFQDLFVQYELSEKPHGFFVEFGAADGISANNTYSMEQHLGWSGILAEPARCWHERLRCNRSCTVDLRCVWSTTGDRVEFNEVMDAPEFSTINSYSAGDLHAAQRIKSRSTYVVQTVSLNDLLTQHRAPHAIDYLSIDTEGSELDILTSFDFEAWDVATLTIEHNYTSNRAAIFDLLTSKGYRRKFTCFSDWDDWYVLKR